MKIMLVGGEDDGRIIDAPEPPPARWVVPKPNPTSDLWIRDDEPIPPDPSLTLTPYALCRRADGTVAYVLMSRVHQLTDWSPVER